MRGGVETRQGDILVMTYTVKCEHRVPVHGGAGGMAQAVQDAVREVGFTPNLDAESIRFHVE